LRSQDLSDLLWAAGGVNREGMIILWRFYFCKDGKHTTNPTAGGVFDVLIYVLKAEGAYLYDPQKHTLDPVVERDLRSDVASGQVWFYYNRVYIVK
jgi:hypothetical protein